MHVYVLYNAADKQSTQIKKVQHLPKCDTIGSCDPQVKVRMSAKEFKTRHIPSTYTASWEEVFKFDASNLNDMEIELSDHNTDPLPPTHIGIYVVKKSVLQELVKRGHGSQQQIQTAVKDKKGVKVVGHDGQETVMQIELSISAAATQAAAAPLPSHVSPHGNLLVASAATDGFGHRLAFEVMINTLEHVPQMDSWLRGGAADPYVKVEYAGQSYTTDVVKNSLRADFKHEQFLFQIGSGDEMVFTVWDWDRLGKNELIGRAVIGRTTIASLSKDGKGKSYFHKFTLQDPKGETVVGKDKENTELSVGIHVVEALRQVVGFSVGQGNEKDKFKRTHSQ